MIYLINKKSLIKINCLYFFIKNERYVYKGKETTLSFSCDFIDLEKYIKQGKYNTNFQRIMEMENKNIFLRYDLSVDDISVLKNCIFEGYDLNICDEYGNSILAKAVYFNKIDVVNELCKSEKVNIHLENINDGLTPFHIACTYGYVEIAELFLQKGIDVNVKDKFDHTGLYFALENDEKEIISLLVKHNCNVNFIYDSHDIDNDYRPLHIAARDNKLDIVKELLKSDIIEVNCIGRNGYTPLHLAVIKNRVEMVQLLISGHNGAHPNFLDHDGYAPIHYAVRDNRIDIVQKLIALPVVDVNFTTSHKDTPLHLACNEGNLDMIKVLLEKKANVNAIEKFGCSPFHCAVIKGRVDIVKELIKYKSDINLYLKNERIQTPLHLAVRNCHIDVIKCLVKNGADLNARNFKNDTPLEMARGYGHHAMFKLLFELKFLKNRIDELLKIK